MAQVAFIPLPDYQEHSPEEMNHRAAEFYDDLRRRRTVREFSDQPVPVEVIKDCLRAAGTAPNGANMQPWHFVVVSDAAIKQKIRVEAEKEEYEFYHHKPRRHGWTRWLRWGRTSTSRSSRLRHF